MTPEFDLGRSWGTGANDNQTGNKGGDSGHSNITSTGGGTGDISLC